MGHGHDHWRCKTNGNGEYGALVVSLRLESFSSFVSVTIDKQVGLVLFQMMSDQVSGTDKTLTGRACNFRFAVNELRRMNGEWKAKNRYVIFCYLKRGLRRWKWGVQGWEGLCFHWPGLGIEEIEDGSRLRNLEWFVVLNVKKRW